MKPAVITGAIALERVMADHDGAREVRVSRKCPKCLHRGSCRGNADGVSHRLVCLVCGNEWIGRVKSSELP